jgi:hypothetical protein
MQTQQNPDEAEFWSDVYEGRPVAISIGMVAGTYISTTSFNTTSCSPRPRMRSRGSRIGSIRVFRPGSTDARPLLPCARAKLRFAMPELGASSARFPASLSLAEILTRRSPWVGRRCHHVEADGQQGTGLR